MYLTTIHKLSSLRRSEELQTALFPLVLNSYNVLTTMSDKESNAPCMFFKGLKKRCMRRKRKGLNFSTCPLPEACRHSKVKVCKVNGDRKTCARMASIGLLPGAELELLCKNHGEQCMVKINGGTVSLDGLTAANILVAPL